MLRPLRAFSALIPYLFVILLAGVVEWAFGWSRLLAPWTEVSLGGLLVAIALMLASYILRAWRVADHFDVRGRFGAVLSLNLQHNLWNNLLPMRAGELSFPILMRQKFGVDPAHALAGLFWIRLVDAQVLAALALGSLLWLAKVESLALLLVGLALVAPFMFWSLRGWLAARVAGMSEGAMRSLLEKALAGLPRDAAHFARGVLLTWANWLVKLAALAWILRQFVAIDWAGAGLGVLGGEVTSVLPIHAPGGFGTYEAGMLGALLPQGLNVEAATGAAINTHLFLLGSSLLFGLVAMLIPGKSATMPAPAKDQNTP
ncbi:MAG: flippase-like domain-containing protein [Halothiobacillaceae bacterium]|nr:MAG: flippase-like domain-containing protein [Halothiobacillaceae bacterium]